MSKELEALENVVSLVYACDDAKNSGDLPSYLYLKDELKLAIDSLKTIEKDLEEKEKEHKVINIISKIDEDVLSHILEDTLLAEKITQEDFNLATGFFVKKPKYYILYEFPNNWSYGVNSILASYNTLKLFGAKEEAQKYIDEVLSNDKFYQGAVFNIAEIYSDYWSED